MENENSENLTVDNTTTGTSTSDNSYSEQLNQIHSDLGFICSFLIFFVLIVLLKYAYKFFDMIFKF